jgi:hypothetical protein
MRKLLFNGFVVFAGVVSLPSSLTRQNLPDRVPTTTQEPEKPTANKSITDDPRLTTLRRFFEERGCPALAVADVFLSVADAYDLDWRLLPSISYVESTGGKQARNNNLFGWDSGRAEFASLAAGVQQVASSLARSRLYRGKDLDEVLETYNPDAEYARKVKSVMVRISPSE